MAKLRENAANTVNHMIFVVAVLLKMANFLKGRLNQKQEKISVQLMLYSHILENMVDHMVKYYGPVNSHATQHNRKSLKELFQQRHMKNRMQMQGLNANNNVWIFMVVQVLC